MNNVILSFRDNTSPSGNYNAIEMVIFAFENLYYKCLN